MHKKYEKKKVIIDTIDFIGIKSHYKAGKKAKSRQNAEEQNKL